MKSVKMLPAILAIFLLVGLSGATTLIKMNESDMIHSADRVALGTIIDSWVEWDPDSGMLYTYSVLAVEHNLLGEDTETGSVLLRSLGGREGDMAFTVPSSPEISIIGERRVVFMWDDLDLYPCNIIGWEQGCVAVDDNEMVAGRNVPLREYLKGLNAIITEMKEEEARHSF